MSDQLSATIIPFPTRIRPVQADLVPEGVVHTLAPLAVPAHKQPNELAHSSQRLTRALADLQLALADQKDATQRWKKAVEDLAAKMRMLGDVAGPQKKSG